MEISKWWIHRPNSILILEMRQVCPRGANIYSDTQLVAANPRQDFLNHICVCMFVLFWVVGGVVFVYIIFLLNLLERITAMLNT